MFKPFKEIDILPSHRTKKKIVDNINNYFEEKKIDNEMEELIEHAEEKYLLDEHSLEMNKAINSKYSKKNKFLDNDIYRKNLRNKLFTEAYSVIIMESLPIDDRYKAVNAKNILDKCSTVLDGIEEEIQLKEDSIFSSIMDSICTRTINIEKDDDNLDRILEEIDMDIFDYKFYGSREFKKVIQETINNEIKISKFRENLNEDSKYDLKEKTLFRTILEKNSKTINEFTEEVNGIDDGIFKDSIIDYAIIESFNFFKLIDFKNKLKLRHMLKYE